MDDLTTLIEDWPVDNAAVAVTDGETVLGLGGSADMSLPIASVTKLLVGYMALIAWEEMTISLDDPAGPPGATVRHLLSHAAGYNFDSDDLLAAPGKRRIYSNVGIEVFCDYLTEVAGMPFAEYLRAAVIDPLGLTTTNLVGSPAHGMNSTVADLAVFARELLHPTLIAPSTMAEASTAQFPELSGVLPGIGSFDPNPWGLTFEIRDQKKPHWTGSDNSPETFGHFGRSGSFLWVDPTVGLAAVSLADRTFGDWSMRAWPDFSDQVIAKYG